MGKSGHHIFINAIGLLVEVRDFEFSFDIYLIFNVRPNAILLGLTVLTDKHKAGQEYGLK